MKTSHTSIHDKFFKGNMQNLSIAKDFLQQHLPAEILELADLDTLHVETETLIDKDLEARYTDIYIR